MAKSPETIRLLPGERLRDTRLQATSMSLPLAVHQRLAMLADTARAVEPSRAEIVAMLIAAAGLDADQLERSLIEYRKKTVGEVLPVPAGDDREDGDALIQIPAPRPGRPRRTG